MTGQPNMRTARTYKVNSLDRGLDVLRVIRSADGPIRNNDISTRTGLPKATVSRLVHTLTTMGYLRRIDQGSYVLGQASGRTGRAMLEALRLERYAPLFQGLVASPGAYACLGIMVAKKMVPVAEKELTINLVAGGKPTQFKIPATPQSDDPSGQSSRFELVDETLCEALDDPKSKARLMLTIAGKQFSGDMAHEDHDH